MTLPLAASEQTTCHELAVHLSTVPIFFVVARIVLGHQVVDGGTDEQPQ
jgi:hypothetical protein